MKIINTFAVLIIISIVLFFITVNLFLVRIEVGEVGVRTKQYALLGEKGVESKDFGAGWHRKLPFLDTWNIFDATVQTAEFTTASEREANNKRLIFFRPSHNSSVPTTGPERIELKSKDGYTVRLDVTVKYRITEDKVHEMYKKFNTDVRYKGIVRDQVQNTMRNVFGTMRTEEFYNPDVRRSKTTEAFNELERDLQQSYVELVNLLIRDISFDTSYERKILDKKLADQDVELNKSRAVAEEKKGLTNKIVAETEAKVRVIEEEKKALQLTMKAETDKQVAQIKADARLKLAKTQADADLYAAELIAKGGLMEKEAVAGGELLRANALNSAGGANLVALEAVKELKLQNMVLSTIKMDFLNIDQMTKQFGANDNTQ